MLRRIFGPKRDEVTGEWRKLQNGELNDLYSSSIIFRGDPIEKNEIGGVCSTYEWRGEVYTGLWWGNRRERAHLEDPCVDGRIILRRIFRKWDVGAWTGSNSLGIWTVGGHL
jgi:hypothetical protein